MNAKGLLLAFLSVKLAYVLSVDVPMVTLNDGREMPAIALGTYLGFDQNGIITPKDNEIRDVVSRAIELGWRHIDTASVYNTETQVGEGVQKKIDDGTVKREDVFITTKLWNTHHKREQVMDALQESLSKLGMSYVDLYLMHWPMGVNNDYSYSPVDYVETWRGLEDVHRSGLARSIGVSNFNKTQVERLWAEASVKPAALQIEIHPQIVQSDLVALAQSYNITVMGYSPFGSLVSRYGMKLPPPRIDDPTLVEIAAKYNKTTPQVVLRWAIDRKIVPIPKTVHQERLLENLDIFDFKMAADEIEKINAFDKGIRYTRPSFWQDHLFYPFEKIEQPIDNPFRQKT